MFALQRPNMALNDPRVASPGGSVRRFQMWNTWDIRTTETRRHMIEWVAHVAAEATGGKLKNLVLSCHGLPGCLQLGEGFNRENMDMFSGWKGLIEKIWLPDCLVARIPDAAMQAQMDRDYPTFGVSDGNVFCSKLAKNVECYVVAPTEPQCEVPVTLPYDQMTSFEGLVVCYDPTGNISWQSRNPSTWTDSAGLCVPVPD